MQIREDWMQSDNYYNYSDTTPTPRMPRPPYRPGQMPPSGGQMPPGTMPPSGGGQMPPGTMPPGRGGQMPPGTMPPGGGGQMPPGTMPPGRGGQMPPGTMPPGGGGQMPPGGGWQMPPGTMPPGGEGQMPPPGLEFMPEMPPPPSLFQPPLAYKSLREALRLIESAVKGEREDELFYDYLISVAPTQEEKAIIMDIRNDERKHNRMFRSIYKSLTGITIAPDQNVEFEKPASYIDGIQRALFGELEAVEKYRDIRAGLTTRFYRDMLFEIITDEIKHSIKYNYILNKNVGK